MVYWNKWKKALDSKKIPTEFNNDNRLMRESEARIRKLKNGMPDIEFPTPETPETPEIQESEEKSTLREYYGFKKNNYDGKEE